MTVHGMLLAAFVATNIHSHMERYCVHIDIVTKSLEDLTARLHLLMRFRIHRSLQVLQS